MTSRQRQRNASLLEELEKKLHRLNQETETEEIEHTNIFLRDLIKPDIEKEEITIDLRIKLENILNIVGDKWHILPTTYSIAKQIHKYYRDEISWLIDIGEFRMSSQIAYLIAKTAAVGGKYNLYETNGEQKQK